MSLLVKRTESLYAVRMAPAASCAVTVILNGLPASPGTVAETDSAAGGANAHTAPVFPASPLPPIRMRPFDTAIDLPCCAGERAPVPTNFWPS